MQSITANPSQELALGHQGENGVVEVRFDLTEFRTKHPNGTPRLLAQRPGEAAPYLVTLSVSGDTAVWTLTSADTALSGYGKCELHWYVGQVLAKTDVFQTFIAPALTSPSATPPAAAQSWVQSVLNAAQTVQSAAASAAHAPKIGDNGNWYVWDSDDQAYADSGVSAGGSGSSPTYELIQKYIIGYSLTDSEPSDWETNWTAYFTNTGTAKSPVYTAVTGETAPTWEAGKYYSYSSDGAISLLPDLTDNPQNGVSIDISAPAHTANVTLTVKARNANGSLYTTAIFEFQMGAIKTAATKSKIFMLAGENVPIAMHRVGSTITMVPGLIATMTDGGSSLIRYVELRPSSGAVIPSGTVIELRGCAAG